MLRANDDVLIMCHTSPGVRFVAPGLAGTSSRKVVIFQDLRPRSNSHSHRVMRTQAQT